MVLYHMIFFSCGHQLHLWAHSGLTVEWCHFGWGKCHIPTRMVGDPSVTSLPRLQGMTTEVGDSCGRWETAFVSFQSYLFFINVYWPHCFWRDLYCLYRALPGQVGHGRQVYDLVALLPCQQWLLALLCCLSFPATFTWPCHNGEKGKCLFPEGNFCPPGPSVKAEAQIVYHDCWSPSGRQTASAATVSVFPPSCLPSLFQYTHFQMSQCVNLPGVFVCWAGKPLLNYSCTICKFKGRNKGALSLGHDGDITVGILKRASWKSWNLTWALEGGLDPAKIWWKWAPRGLRM